MVRSLGAIVLIALTTAPRAQQTAPARDVDVAPTNGTASISGTVVTDEAQPNPVRRAIVSLSGPDLRPSRGAITDDEGRFTIGNLPAGRFALTLSRSAFVTSAYGAKRPGRPGTPVVVRDGERVTGLVARLWRGAVLTGTVRDESGAPVPGVPVTAIPARPAINATILTLTNNGALTDGNGEFRIFGLEPGSYLLTARPASGGGGPMTSMTEAQVDAAFEALRQRAPAIASSAPNTRTAGGEAPRPFDYAAVYFPGTSVISQATPLTLEAGQQRTGLEIPLLRVMTASVAGIVTRSDGQPVVAASLQLDATVPPGPFTIESPLQINATSGADGRFTIAQVPPGDYSLLVRAPVNPPPSEGNISTPTPSGPLLWGQLAVSINGSDLRDVSITVQPGASITGRLVFAGQTLTPPANLAQWRIGALPAFIAALRPGTSIPIRTLAFTPPVNVKADGTFEITNLGPGRYVLQLNGAGLGPTSWWTRSAMAGDRDLLDGPIEISVGFPSTAIVVTLSDRHTSLTGTLQTVSGSPASDVFVVAFATDRSTWRANSRRVRTVRPDVDGRYAFADLPPGDYLLAAVIDLDPTEADDPAFLEQLVTASLKISIGEGEQKIQDLRVGG